MALQSRHWSGGQIHGSGEPFHNCRRGEVRSAAETEYPSPLPQARRSHRVEDLVPGIPAHTLTRMLWKRLRESPASHLGLLVCFALVVRFLHLAEVAESPLYRHITEPDSSVYLEQGRAVAGGDLAGSEVFKLSPLYRYLLGAILAVGGDDILWIRVVQSLLGALNCGLVYLIGRRLWGAKQGLVAAFILALYSPTIFYESKVINEPWVIAANLGGVLCLLSYREHRRAWELALCGLCLGLSCILRANALLLTLLFAGIGFLYQGDLPRRRLLHLLGFAGGWALAALPVLLRNWIIGGQFVLLVTNLGPELYMGSHPDSPAIGHGVPFFIEPHPRTISEGFREQAGLLLGREMSHEEASRFWVKQTLKEILSRPGDYVRLLSRKLRVAAHNFEATDNTVYEYEKQQSVVLAFAFIGFGLLLALSGPGLVIALRTRRTEQLPLLACLVAYAASLAMTAVIGRYRLPAVPVMALYGAALLTAISGWIAGREWKPLLPCFCLFAGLMGISSSENGDLKHMKRERMAEAHQRLARINQLERSPQEALRNVQEAVHWLPEAATLYLLPGLPYEKANPYELAWERRRGMGHHELAPSRKMLVCAQVLEEGGSPETAEQVLRTAWDYYPRKEYVLAELLGNLFRQRKFEALREVATEATAGNRTSVHADYYQAISGPGAGDSDYFVPQDGFDAMHRGRMELKNHRLKQAHRLFQVALKRAFTHSAEAHYLFARACSGIGDYGKAQEHLKLCAQLSPDYARLAEYEAKLIRLASLGAEGRHELLKALLSGWRIQDLRQLQGAMPEGESPTHVPYPHLSEAE